MLCRVEPVYAPVKVGDSLAVEERFRLRGGLIVASVDLIDIDGKRGRLVPLLVALALVA